MADIPIQNYRFTNKIQSSLPGWPEYLVLVAKIFSEFHGDFFEREQLTERFGMLSKRLPGSRDESDFRDEYGAYERFLGLLYEDANQDGQVLCFSETARHFLLSDEPNVAAFLIHQLLLFQTPNGIGLKWNKGGPSFEPNSQVARGQMLRSGRKLAPFRLIVQTLWALKNLAGQAHAFLTNEETVHLVFNSEHLRADLRYEERLAKSILDNRRAGTRLAGVASDHLRNYHILNHTGLANRIKGGFELPNDDVTTCLSDIYQGIYEMDSAYDGLDPLMNTRLSDDDLKSQCILALGNGSWNEYYDPLKSDSLGLSNIAISGATALISTSDHLPRELSPYKFRDLPGRRQTAVSLADPEETRIKHERANTDHRLAEQVLYERICLLGGTPRRSNLIDMFAKLDKDYLFEIKSISSGNILSQIRKGVSQLFEYRFREALPIGTVKVLFLASPPEGQIPSWTLPYLEEDRGLAVTWIDPSGDIFCTDKSRRLMDGIPTRT